jgi:hypothetical protein
MPQRGRPALFSRADLRDLRRAHRHISTDRGLQNQAYAEQAATTLRLGELITPTSWLVEAGRMLVVKI